MTSSIKKKSNVILGIDPGSSTIGYGLIRSENNSNNPIPITYGYIDLSNLKSIGEKLVQLNSDLTTIIKKYKPNILALESLFFFKNAKTLIPVLQCRGVILFTARKLNLDIYEYTPLQVKQTITGYGKAEKHFVQKLVLSSLNIKGKIKPDDVSDALAIALCHFRHMN